MASCPVCGGPGVPLGALGNRKHYRCRNCGADFSKLAKKRAKRPRSTPRENPRSSNTTLYVIGGLALAAAAVGGYVWYKRRNAAQAPATTALPPNVTVVSPPGFHPQNYLPLAGLPQLAPAAVG